MHQVRFLENLLVINGLYVLYDIEGNTYNVIAIGNQVWMASNLKTKTYNNGSPIPTATSTDWTNSQIGLYLNNNDPYGYYYNWNAVNTGLLCPDGWHVPTVEDFNILRNTLGGTDVAGGPLKATGTQYWQSPNEGATNTSGFTAIPSGAVSAEFTFINQGTEAAFWTSTPVTGTNPPYFYVQEINTLFQDGYAHYNYGLSVRCIRDF